MTSPPQLTQLTEEGRVLHAIDQLLRAVPGVRRETLTLGELLDREAQALQMARAVGHPGAAYLIRGSKHRSGTTTDAEVLAAPLEREGARACMARWHWFDDLDAVGPHALEFVDPRFEAACDAIVDGNAATLAALLEAEPTLARARSRSAHHQTLLQHVAANGIENSRQWQSPPNAVALAELLLQAGAEPDAGCDSYGGATAMTLLVSSAHPAAAGVQGELVTALCRGGAKPDGPDDDSAPLWTAIGFGYPAAVDALVRCGARVDNLLFAAAAGDLGAAATYFDEQGHLRPEARSFGRARAVERVRRPEQALDPRHMLEYALAQAAVHRRGAMVDFLLGKGPELTVKEPVWNNTLLDCARYGGDPAIIARVTPLFDETGRPR
jgi:hypothetical protein